MHAEKLTNIIKITSRCGIIHAKSILNRPNLLSMYLYPFPRIKLKLKLKLNRSSAMRHQESDRKDPCN